MSTQKSQQDLWKQQVGEAAAQLIDEGMVVGLGTGTTANYLVLALGERVRQGLHIIGAVSSSQATMDLAASLNIPLTDLDHHPVLDIYIDGADEIDPQLQLIKGAGGALVREKIVASSAKHFVVIADPSKLVKQLGHIFPLPVEVTPLAKTPVKLHLEALGANVTLRVRNGETFITDNKNNILDCTFPQGITDPVTLDAKIQSIVGVVETGLFLNMAEKVLIGGPEGVKVLHR
ncbi:ribose-5-phosphate isomerase A [Ktedonobacteria bacterium brp13]|nr:ribose-5-phosphate isomerase A [Ktedonobacteria bacterium brp13]